MTDQVHDVTTLPKQSRFTKSKTTKWVAVGVFAFGTLLLIDDQVKKLGRKLAGDTVETPEA